MKNFEGRIIKGSEFTTFNYDQESLGHKVYPYAMICIIIDADTMIAVGTDPLSPRDYFEKNKSKSFSVDWSIPPKKMLTMHGDKTVYYAKCVETEVSATDEVEYELDFVFRSSDHLRFENKSHVSGPHGGAPRAVKVEPNISGEEGYTVAVYNIDGEKATIQMAPKQMKLVSADQSKIHLKGYGSDIFGSSFADYGLTIFHNNGNIEKCTLHMLDRNIDIEYLP